MLINKEKLLKAINDSTYDDKINIVELVEKSGLTARGIYYASEAKFILDNIQDSIDDGLVDSKVCKILNKNPELENTIIHEIVDFTDDYEAPVEHDTFIDDALEIIKNYTREH